VVGPFRDELSERWVAFRTPDECAKKALLVGTDLEIVDRLSGHDSAVGAKLKVRKGCADWQSANSSTEFKFVRPDALSFASS
jgi:hypothetical protein